MPSARLNAILEESTPWQTFLSVFQYTKRQISILPHEGPTRTNLRLKITCLRMNLLLTAVRCKSLFASLTWVCIISDRARLPGGRSGYVG